MKRHLQPLPVARRAKETKAAWYWLAAKIRDPDLVMVAAFCVCGLLITLNVIVRFPDFALAVN